MPLRSRHEGEHHVDLVLRLCNTMGDHHFETLQVFETGDFLIQYKSYLHGIFYIAEYTPYK